MYKADSIKVALGIGNGTLGIHCLMITRTNHCIVLFAQIIKATFIVLGTFVSFLFKKRIYHLKIFK